MLSYVFRLYPTKIQEQRLHDAFGLCRFTYNKLLEEVNKRETVDRSQIQHRLVELKREYPALRAVYSKTLQYECHRLFANLSVLSMAKKSGRKVGKLRFKGKDSLKTIHYNQSGFRLIKLDQRRHDKLHLSKIGEISVRCHRGIQGMIKQVSIKKKVDCWYAIIITDGQRCIQNGTGEIGLDLGIINFCTDSSGNKVMNPLFLKRSLARIRAAHSVISKKKKGSNNRKKAIVRLLKKYEKITNQRRDFFHKLSTRFVKENMLIAIENLNIKSMTDKSKGSKYHNMRNTLDSSWGEFISMLKFKAESAGTDIVEVNPMNTSKTCSNCGHIQDMPLNRRVYICQNCGISIDRDHNAAINMLRIAKGLGFVETEVARSMKQEVTKVAVH